MVLKDLKMAEGSTAAMIYNEPLAVSSRIVSSQTMKKVNDALLHSSNTNQNIENDSDVEDEAVQHSAEASRKIQLTNEIFDDQTNHSTVVDSNKLDQNSVLQNISSTNQTLLDEIDNQGPKELESKSSGKRGGTLSKIFRSIRKDKDNGNSSEEGHLEPAAGSSTMSLGKLIQKVNPVGKNNRETMSKVLQRIGDAFQKVHPNSNESNTESDEHVSKSTKTFGKLIQFQHLTKSKSSSYADHKQKSKPGSKLSSNYRSPTENNLDELGDSTESSV